MGMQNVREGVLNRTGNKELSGRGLRQTNVYVCTCAHIYIFSRECLSSPFAVNLRAALQSKLNCVHCAIYKC